MSSGARGRGNGVWKYSYGAKPHVVFAMERRDCGGEIFVRWTNPDKAGVEKRDRRSLGLVVRDATGRLDAKRVRAAEPAVQQFQGETADRSIACAPAKRAAA